MTLTEQEKQILEDYHRLCHAMQTGVAMEQGIGSNDGTPKHLRMGINTTKCDHAALVKLLIERGIINQTDYFKAIRAMMREEVDNYELRLGAATKKSITLL